MLYYRQKKNLDNKKKIFQVILKQHIFKGNKKNLTTFYLSPAFLWIVIETLLKEQVTRFICPSIYLH